MGVKVEETEHGKKKRYWNGCGEGQHQPFGARPPSVANHSDSGVRVANYVWNPCDRQAVDQKTKQTVAIKKSRPFEHQTHAMRTLREVQILNRMDHENVSAHGLSMYLVLDGVTCR